MTTGNPDVIDRSEISESGITETPEQLYTHLTEKAARQDFSSHMHNPGSCPVIRRTMDRVGDKWTSLIILTLSEGPERFGALRRRVEGISQRMLSLSLRNLERDGLVARHVEPTSPPQVSYQLTPLGKSLLLQIKSLALWAQNNYQKITEAEQAYDKTAEKRKSL